MQKISDVLRPRDTYWINAEDTVRQAVRYLCDRKTGAVAVRNGEDIVGVFSERDLMHRVVNKGRDPNLLAVKDVMSEDLIFIHADDEFHMAKAKMFKNGVRHLLVVGKDNAFRGLVSMRDLIETDVAESSELIHKLNDVYFEKAYKTKWRISSNRVITETYTQPKA